MLIFSRKVVISCFFSSGIQSPYMSPSVCKNGIWLLVSLWTSWHHLFKVCSVFKGFIGLLGSILLFTRILRSIYSVYVYSEICYWKMRNQHLIYNDGFSIEGEALANRDVFTAQLCSRLTAAVYCFGCWFQVCSWHPRQLRSIKVTAKRIYWPGTLAIWNVHGRRGGCLKLKANLQNILIERLVLVTLEFNICTGDRNTKGDDT